MPADLVITGTEELARIGPALRGASKEIRSEFYRGVNRSVKPLTAAVKDSASDYLPDRYADVFASSLKTSTRRRLSGTSPSVRLVGRAKTKGGKVRELAKLNRGTLRHPLFGNRRFWFDQSVRAGVWDDPLRDNADEVREELLRVFAEVADKIARSV